MTYEETMLQTTHSCDACGAVFSDPDECLCPLCKALAKLVSALDKANESPWRHHGSRRYYVDSIESEAIGFETSQILVKAGIVTEHNNGYCVYTYSLTALGKKAIGPRLYGWHNHDCTVDRCTAYC